MAGLENYNINDPSTWGSRGDGTTKGTGFFCILPASGGRIMTEYGMGFDYDGKEIEVPLINPYQSQAQILEVLQGKQPNNLSDHKGLEGVRSQQ